MGGYLTDRPKPIVINSFQFQDKTIEIRDRIFENKYAKDFYRKNENKLVFEIAEPAAGWAEIFSKDTELLYTAIEYDYRYGRFFIVEQVNCFELFKSLGPCMKYENDQNLVQLPCSLHHQLETYINQHYPLRRFKAYPTQFKGNFEMYFQENISPNLLSRKQMQFAHEDLVTFIKNNLKTLYELNWDTRIRHLIYDWYFAHNDLQSLAEIKLGGFEYYNNETFADHFNKIERQLAPLIERSSPNFHRLEEKNLLLCMLTDIEVEYSDELGPNEKFLSLLQSLHPLNQIVIAKNNAKKILADARTPDILDWEMRRRRDWVMTTFSKMYPSVFEEYSELFNLAGKPLNCMALRPEVYNIVSYLPVKYA